MLEHKMLVHDNGVYAVYLYMCSRLRLPHITDSVAVDIQTVSWTQVIWWHSQYKHSIHHFNFETTIYILAYIGISIGVGAGPVGPVLTGPFFREVNEIHN